MRISVGLVGLVLGGSIARETLVTYKYESGTVTIRHFSDMTSDGIERPKANESKEKHASFTGNLAELDFAERGIHAQGKSFDCRWEPGNATKVTLNNALIEGSARIVFDNDVAFRAQTARHKETDTPLLAPSDWNRYQVDSERIVYSGDATVGVMRLPQPWTLDRKSQGEIFKAITEKDAKSGKTSEKQVKIHFDQTLDCSGTRGELNVGMGDSGELDQLTSGHFEGPVHFKMERRETTVGTNEVHTTSYVGVADSLDLDMVHVPGLITALGHVSVDAWSDGDPSNIVVDRFVIIVDKRMEPIGYRLGSGTETTRAKDGSK